MNTLSIVGAQWGDEGKGKITDLIGSSAKYVVRYQGGNNAGHTIEFDGKKYALRLMPSGVFNKGTEVVIAQGVVINPETLLSEINMLKENDYDFKLHISDRSNIIFPFHEELDLYYEDIKGDLKIGTTKKGIGPAYSDKINRIGIRVAELLDKEIFEKKLKYLIEYSNSQLKSGDYKKYSFDDIFNRYNGYANEIRKYVTDTSYLIDTAIKNGETVVFEGAQGVMLDIEHGTYPYVTSSSPSSSSIPINVGIAPQYVNNSLGIMKAYTSRVGEGPFPTEISGDVSETIIKVGREYGTVTKRKRRVGWLDLVQMQHSIRVSGFTQLTIMLLDVLSSIEEIKVCVGYELDGKSINVIPALEKDYKRVKPIYETLPGWNMDISKVSKFEDFPKEAIDYIELIESKLNLPINIVSVGPDRKQTIIRKNLI